MSEQLLLINPRRRRRRKMSAKQRKYFGKRRRARRAPSRIRARRRHRVAAHTAVRRRRRYRVRAHMSNPRRRRSSRRRSFRIRARHFNPRFNVRGVVRETLVPAGIGAGGAILTDVAYAYAQPYLPAALQSGVLPVIVKLGVALGVGFAAGKVAGRKVGEAVTLGGVTVVAYGAIKGAIASALPTVKGLSGYQDFVDYSVTGSGARGDMGAYMQRRLGFISPAPTVGGSGVGDLSAYMRPAGVGGLDGADWQNDGM